MPISLRSHLVVAVASLALASCGGGSVLLPAFDAGPDGPTCRPTTTLCTSGTDMSHYAPGLAPLADDAAPAPAAANGDPYPETLSTLNGRISHAYWVQARGYVHASVATTWATLQDANVAVDRRRINRWTVDQLPGSPYPFAIVVHNVVQSLVEVDFDITWGGAIDEGTADAPTLVSLRWDKTAGSSYITTIEGTCVLRVVTPDVTEIELVQEEDAIGQSPESITQFIVDFYQSIVASVHGQPLPTYM